MARTLKSRVIRATSVTGVGVIAVVALALPASAHVTVSPATAPAGGYVQLSFNVPTESDTASTTKLDVLFPAATPIASVEVQPRTGWTYQVKTGTPAKPVTDDDGNKITQVVNEVIWTADGPGIRPGEFDSFVVSAGPLPTGAPAWLSSIQRTTEVSEYVCSALKLIDFAPVGSGPAETTNESNSPGLMPGPSAVQMTSLTT